MPLSALACDTPAEGCTAPARPLDLYFEVMDPFPDLASFKQPVGLYQTRALAARMFVLEKGGRVLSFDVRAPDAGSSVVLDLSARVRTRKECGLLGMAFHPAFADNAEVLLSYCAATEDTMLRIARYRYDPRAAAIDAGSEEVILELPAPRNFHHAGQIRFDPSGYLLVSVGDTGPHRDPEGHAQNTGDLLGDFLRLDVDGGRPYAIPPDNPFAPSGMLAGMGRPEIYAWGFRNPWSFSIDRETGEIWAGDVGFEDQEEVDWVRPGHNYGWAAMEGLLCRKDDCGGLGFTPPVATLRNRGNTAVIGGYVYRGEAISSLQGTYVFADFGGGALYGIFDPYGAAETRLIHPSTGLSPSFFHEDLAGELYFTDIGKGRIHQLVPSNQRARDGFPERLSETGCVSFFADGQPEPSGAALPYGVRMPLWSDGADKTRYVNLQGTRASLAPNGDLEFPIGTVLVKLFHIGGRLVEGRLLVRHDDGGWGGYSYEWDANANDGMLLTEGKTELIDEHPWTYPSREDCFSCHSSAAGVALGPELGQLESPALAEDPGELPWPALPEESANVFTRREDDDGDDAHWARAYLHANCSSCHRPGGGSNADIDLRRSGDDGENLPLARMNACDVAPVGENLGILDAVIIAPGSPERSVLLARMARRGVHQMPPLGSAIVDDLAVERVRRWIASLANCE